MAANRLRQLLELGILTPDDLTDTDRVQAGMIDMPQPRTDIAPMQPNTMRVENGPDAGKVTSLDFRSGAGAQQGPSWDDLRARMGSGGQQPRQMRVVGAGNGSTVDLSPEPAGPVALDYSRAPVDVPGVGKAYYSKDGRGAYVMGPDGQPSTKVILGYDQQGSMDLNKWFQDRRKAEADISQSQASTDHAREQIAASEQARNTKEGIPGAGIPQSLLDKQYGKAPEGKRWTFDGELVDIPGGSGKALTESQGKAAGLATRAQAAHDILTGLEGTGVTTPSLIKQGAEGVPVIGGALGMAVNKVGIPSESQQKVEQAQRDFVNAALRVESGASISQSEFDNARKQYFPQPGDAPAVILQKQQAREREIKSLGIQAGRGASNIPAATGGKSAAIADARAAIAKGAPRDKVLQRLQSMGISPSEV